MAYMIVKKKKGGFHVLEKLQHIMAYIVTNDILKLCHYKETSWFKYS